MSGGGEVVVEVELVGMVVGEVVVVMDYVKKYIYCL